MLLQGCDSAVTVGRIAQRAYLEMGRVAELLVTVAAAEGLLPSM